MFSWTNFINFHFLYPFCFLKRKKSSPQQSPVVNECRLLEKSKYVCSFKRGEKNMKNGGKFTVMRSNKANRMENDKKPFAFHLLLRLPSSDRRTIFRSSLATESEKNNLITPQIPPWQWILKPRNIDRLDVALFTCRIYFFKFPTRDRVKSESFSSLFLLR